MNEKLIIAAANKAADMAALDPLYPEGSDLHADSVAAATLYDLGIAAEVYKGDRLPIAHHALFGEARKPAFIARLFARSGDESLLAGYPADAAVAIRRAADAIRAESEARRAFGEKMMAETSEAPCHGVGGALLDSGSSPG